MSFVLELDLEMILQLSLSTVQTNRREQNEDYKI